MKYKRFARIFIISIIIFILFHSFIWEVLNNKKLLSPPEGHMVGDLSRISYCPSCAKTRPNATYTIEHSTKLQNIDMLTFGDSFSAGAGGGENPYYQDYIAKYNNISVKNISNPHKPVGKLIDYIKNGEIDKIKPKYVLLQSAEKSVIERLTKDIDLTPIQTINAKETRKAPKVFCAPPKAKFINTGNYKFAIYNLLYPFNQRAFIATAYRMSAKAPVEGHRFVLVHKNEIKYLNKITEKNIQKININLNKINKALEKKGIKFYFMITPDKYDLYYDFFSEPFEPNYLFELLRKQKKDYGFIDTKEILSNELKKGNTDVYFFDDTHWTHKASDAIFRQMKFE